MFDRYDIPKSLKSATMHLQLGDSYTVAYHSTDTTNISNVSLKKLLSHTATKDELTVFCQKNCWNSQKAWQNKAEASHRDGV